MSTVGAGAVRSGWLTKKAEKLGRSKKRYFSLVPSQVSWCKHMHFKLTTATLLLISTFFFPSLHVLCFFFQHTRPLLQQFTQRDAADWSRLRVAGVCLSSMCTGREQQYTQTFINDVNTYFFVSTSKNRSHLYSIFPAQGALYYYDKGNDDSGVAPKVSRQARARACTRKSTR